LGTVILPKLSRKHAMQSSEEFSATLDWALRWVLLLGMPSAVGLLVLAGPMMASLFHSGEFTGDDVQMAARALMAYALGLVAFMGIKVLAPGFYARQDMKTPVRIAVIAMGANVAFSLLLMFPLGHTGLALATTISAAVNAALLLRGLLRQDVYRPEAGWNALILRSLGACLIMGLVLWWGCAETVQWLEMGTWDRVLRLLGWILAGAAAYAMALLAFGIRPRHFLAR
jgi:putative peptidoglycan lipid II flippase